MWQRLQDLPWFVRWPLKWAVFGLTLFLVSFPDPRIFVRHVQHWRDPNAMLDPDLPELQPWVAELRILLKPEMKPRQALKTVEKFVYQKVPYKFDWETWGSADYLPTLPEVLDMGAEDCDGQAVVAASLLRKLGYQADLVTDFAHVWVKTEHGDTMSPGKRHGAVAGKKGVEVRWRALTETLPQALAYSVSPFPLGRELIVVAVAWLLLLRPRTRWSIRLICLATIIQGLLFMRAGGANWKQPVVWAQWWGLVQLVGAAGVLLVFGWRAGRRVPPEAEAAVAVGGS
ncbi:MAG: transglutaminase domain-containing protein [Planctomycetes bacterium]|nr:transglutaminase domain-containing protein [Planctomycetota bacterium]